MVAVLEYIKIIASKPRVFLDLNGPSVPEPVFRFPEDEFVDEISCLYGPAARNVSAPDLNLFTEDVVSDLSSGAPEVRTLAEHELETDDADGVVVDCDAVVVSAHDLWSHVPGRAGGVLVVFRFDDSGYSEVSDSKITFRVHDNVLGLYVPVDDAFVVDVLQGVQDAGNEEFYMRGVLACCSVNLRFLIMW